MKLFSVVTVILALNSMPALCEENPVPSQETTLKIIEVDTAKKKGAAEASGDVSAIKPGQSFVSQSKDVSCRVQVTDVKSNVVQLDLSNCAGIDKVSVGQVFKKSLIESVQAPPTKAPQEKIAQEPVEDEDDRDDSLKIFAKVYYSFANKLKADDVKVVSGSTGFSGSAEYNTNSVPGISVELFKVPRHSWGVAGGLEFDFKRTVDSLSGNLNGINISGVYTDPKPAFGTGDVYVNAVYRWQSFYIPFGLNWSYISTQNTTSNFSGTVGAQAAVGWIFDRFAIEIGSRVLQYKATGAASGAAVDFGLIQLAGLQLNLKYGWDL